MPPDRRQYTGWGYALVEAMLYFSAPNVCIFIELLCTYQVCPTGICIGVEVGNISNILILLTYWPFICSVVEFPIINDNLRNSILSNISFLRESKPQSLIHLGVSCTFLVLT